MNAIHHEKSRRERLSFVFSKVTSSNFIVSLFFSNDVTVVMCCRQADHGGQGFISMRTAEKLSIVGRGKDNGGWTEVAIVVISNHFCIRVILMKVTMNNTSAATPNAEEEKMIPLTLSQARHQEALSRARLECPGRWNSLNPNPNPNPNLH